MVFCKKGVHNKIEIVQGERKTVLKKYGVKISWPRKYMQKVV